MRVLLIGSGGREHALAWKIAKSPEVSEVICAPGNAGIALEPKVTLLPVSTSDLAQLVNLAEQQKPDLVVVGPEQPLAIGLVDRLDELGIKTFGPKLKGAQLEGSKVFAKELMQRHKIPTAEFGVFSEFDQALDFVKSKPGDWVVKADGLAAGKGVLMCSGVEQAERALKQVMLDRAFGEAGQRVVVEETLQGEEASCIAISDGRDILMMASSQDHKRALDGDQGLNTGGMGAYSPAPALDAAMEKTVTEKVFTPLIAGMAAEGIDFKGIIYAGLMITPAGPQVLEFNVRLGDPETQPLLVRLKSDLVPAMLATIEGKLSSVSLEWDKRPSVCVVMASGGYPESYQKGKTISGLGQAAEMQDVVVFHAGTSKKDNQIVTSGGRVLGVTALGEDIQQAVDRAYAATKLIKFDGAHYRTDIAHRALARLP
jgi:phosphoribosylamine---glycine ligase